MTAVPNNKEVIAPNKRRSARDDLVHWPQKDKHCCDYSPRQLKQRFQPRWGFRWWVMVAAPFCFWSLQTTWRALCGTSNRPSRGLCTAPHAIASYSMRRFSNFCQASDSEQLRYDPKLSLAYSASLSSPLLMSSIARTITQNMPNSH